MADVVLKNNTKHPKKMLVFNLREPSVKVVNRTTVESRDGERRVKATSKLVPDALRIASGATSGPLPETVLFVPEIARAIAARELVVQTAPKDAGPKPKRRV